MRKLMLLAALCCPLLAVAEAVIEVDSHHFMRLPAQGSVLQLKRLVVADNGTLLIPVGVSELRIDELYLGHNAQIAIAPSNESLHLDIGSGEIASGAQISAPGAPGTAQRAAVPGRTLVVRLQAVSTDQWLLDARGGRGASGYAGLDGANGKTGGCAWGQASAGHDGQDGTDGHPGAPGGQVRLEVPADFPIERLQARLEGGAGGPAGVAGNAGAGGASKGCWIYSTSGARDGRPGMAGQPGTAGHDGRLDVVRF
ncbi:collagen-like protein [Pseudomonas sp. MM211]|uniref:collagen-like protein n=1 Tax=Pseudomonas sp. MM211 TaxID=2866808 RepID=UPI001CEC7309|nr:collagen-like protein [Pseudomonas sp. MM211]UCJ16528.1 collagen-like protein [Pseudomonas sp. MM211]